MRPFPSILFLLLLCTICIARNGDSQNLNYQVKISESNKRLADIRASLMIEKPYLKMNPWGIPPEIKRGWAQFVDIKSVTDRNGKAINFSWDDENNRWNLEAAENSEIRLHYQVHLRHDDYDWDKAGGIDGRPTVFDDKTVFWVTKGLFIYPETQSKKKAGISFDVPENWKVSTAWIKLSDRRFLADDISMLSSNLLMLGEHEEKVIKYDNMSITIAVAPNFAHRLSLLEETLKDVLPIYRDIFGELPTANYLICASQNKIEDGEAYNNSFHQMFLDQNLNQRKIIWANTLAHEMFHYWNGIYFLYSDDFEGNYWFSEGFTEYYSNLALIRAGIVSQEEYLTKLAFQFSRFYNSQKFAQTKPPGLVKAGSQKIKHWQLIYGGGSSVAFMLDVEIRERTRGKKSLDDFMRVLYRKYGKTEKSMTLEGQIRELNNLTNTDFQPFFDKYVTGTKPYLPAIFKAAEKSGLIVAQFQGEFYLKPGSDEKSSIFQSIIKRK
jgi:predicted metalloprotease with PDZ domain